MRPWSGPASHVASIRAMSEHSSNLTVPAQPLSEADYHSICSALMETGRGRWFLAEYQRRNRNADTEMLLAAIGRLESALQAKAALPPAMAEPEPTFGLAFHAAPNETNHLAVPDFENRPSINETPDARRPATPPHDALRDIMVLSDEEKIALFT